MSKGERASFRELGVCVIKGATWQLATKGSNPSPWKNKLWFGWGHILFCRMVGIRLSRSRMTWHRCRRNGQPAEHVLNDSQVLRLPHRDEKFGFGVEFKLGSGFDP